MSSWTQQLGYPVVHVKQDGGELVLRQNQFLANGKRDNSTQWVVPITLKTSDGQTLAVVMDQAEVRWLCCRHGRSARSTHTGHKRAGEYRCA